MVAPLGNNSLFAEQFAIVSNVREVPYYELYKPKFAQNYQSPFKFLNWADGSLLFEYKRLGQLTDQDAEFVNLQSSKRILMVMGLINYPEIGPNGWEGPGSVTAELAAIADQFPHIVIQRYLVFNFPFDAGLAPPLGGVDPSDPDAVVIFPPHMHDVHYREVLCRAAVKLVVNLQTTAEGVLQSISTASSTALVPLLTTHDKDTSSKGKSRRGPRARKWLGDLCMQVCSPLDAIDHYVSAIHDCRASSGEGLWLGSALDGYASAIILLKALRGEVDEVLARDLRTLPGVKGEEERIEAERVYLLAEERLLESIGLYASCGMRLLEVSACLRLAAMLAAAPAFSDQGGKVVEALLRALAVQQLSPVQALEVAVESALLCTSSPISMDLQRKALLFTYLASLMAGDMGNLAAAEALVQQAHVLGGAGMWKKVEARLLTHAIVFAQQAQAESAPDTQACARLCGECLTLLGASTSSGVRPALPLTRKALGLDKAAGLTLPATQAYLASQNASPTNATASIVPPPPAPTPQLTEEALAKLSTSASASTPVPSVSASHRGSVDGDHGPYPGPLTGIVPGTGPVRSRKGSTLSGTVPAPSAVARTVAPEGGPEDFLSHHLGELAAQAEGIVRRLASSTQVPVRRGGKGSVGALRKAPAAPAGAQGQVKGHRFSRDKGIRRLLLDLDSQGTAPAPMAAAAQTSASDVLPPPPPHYLHADLSYVLDLLEAAAASNTSAELPQQAGLVALLTSLSASSSSSSSQPVTLPIRLLSLSPLQCASNKRPRRITTLHPCVNAFLSLKALLGTETEAEGGAAPSVAGSGSAFYYDPFAAKRKLLAQPTTEDVRWGAEDQQTVRVLLTNPLQVALHPSAVCLHFRGSAEGTVVHPLDAPVPALGQLTVEVPVTLSTPEEVQFTGVSLRYGALTSTFLCPAEASDKVEVVGGAPHALMVHTSWEVPSSGTAAEVLTSTLSLCAGETRREVLSVAQSTARGWAVGGYDTEIALTEHYLGGGSSRKYLPKPKRIVVVPFAYGGVEAKVRDICHLPAAGSTPSGVHVKLVPIPSTSVEVQTYELLLSADEVWAADLESIELEVTSYEVPPSARTLLCLLDTPEGVSKPHVAQALDALQADLTAMCVRTVKLKVDLVRRPLCAIRTPSVVLGRGNRLPPVLRGEEQDEEALPLEDAVLLAVEVSNASEDVLVIGADPQAVAAALFTPPTGCSLVWDMDASPSQVIPPLPLLIPAHATCALYLRYARLSDPDTHPASHCQGLGLHWAYLDRERVVSVYNPFTQTMHPRGGAGSNIAWLDAQDQQLFIRSGRIACPQAPLSALRLDRHGPLIAQALSSGPGYGISISLLLPDSRTIPLYPRTTPSVVQLSPMSKVQLLLSTASSTPLEVHISCGAPQGIQEQGTKCPSVLLTGKTHAFLPAPRTAHKLQMCFLRPGSFHLSVHLRAQDKGQPRGRWYAPEPMAFLVQMS